MFLLKCRRMVEDFFFFSSRRRHTRSKRDWSSDVCSSDLKLHEEVVRGRITEVLAELGEGDLKGEVVVVLEGERVAGSPPLDQVVEEARELVVDGMRKREAARAVAERHGIAANDVYRVLVTDP